MYIKRSYNLLYHSLLSNPPFKRSSKGYNTKKKLSIVKNSLDREFRHLFLLFFSRKNEGRVEREVFEGRSGVDDRRGMEHTMEIVLIKSHSPINCQRSWPSLSMLWLRTLAVHRCGCGHRQYDVVNRISISTCSTYVTTCASERLDRPSSSPSTWISSPAR